MTKRKRFDEGGFVRDDYPDDRFSTRSATRKRAAEAAKRRVVKNDDGFRSSYTKAQDDYGAAKAVEAETTSKRDKEKNSRERISALDRTYKSEIEKSPYEADLMRHLYLNEFKAKGGKVVRKADGGQPPPSRPSNLDEAEERYRREQAAAKDKTARDLQRQQDVKDAQDDFLRRSRPMGRKTNAGFKKGGVI